MEVCGPDTWLIEPTAQTRKSWTELAALDEGRAFQSSGCCQTSLEHREEHQWNHYSPDLATGSTPGVKWSSSNVLLNSLYTIQVAMQAWWQSGVCRHTSARVHLTAETTDAEQLQVKLLFLSSNNVHTQYVVHEQQEQLVAFYSWMPIYGGDLDFSLSITTVIDALDHEASSSSIKTAVETQSPSAVASR